MSLTSWQQLLHCVMGYCRDRAAVGPDAQRPTPPMPSWIYLMPTPRYRECGQTVGALVDQRLRGDRRDLEQATCRRAYGAKTLCENRHG